MRGGRGLRFPRMAIFIFEVNLVSRCIITLVIEGPVKDVGSLMLVTGELSRALTSNKHGRDEALDLVVLQTLHLPVGFSDAR